MDFSWTKEQVELRDTIREFCRRKLDDGEDLEARERAEKFSREKFRLCAEQGLIGMVLPVEDGGIGAGALTTALLMETLGAGCPDTGLLFSLAAHTFACVKPLHRFGTPEQKAKWLPGMLDGSVIAAHAISEPEAGSDIFAMRTRAAVDNDDYVVNGSKCFSTNAPVADVFMVHARTAEGRGFFGLTGLIVERGTPGFEVGGAYHKVGLRTSPMGDLFFDDCRVPTKNRIGPEGGGAAVFMHSMNWERTCLFAIYVGAMQRQLDRCVEYARTRKQFDQRIGSFQAVSHRIVDMKIRLEAARLMLYRAAWALDEQPSDNVTPAMAKIFISEAAVQLGLDAVQIHGGLGVMAGEMERLLRDAVPSRIFSGTSEIQRNNIAKALRL
ncbi:MAG: acyl-CoA dehydrogenase family protein [Myxococcales bacterium]|nr:acyl-CoA dehydrogenase family protein [Myxococcales bacterium]